MDPPSHVPPSLIDDLDVYHDLAEAQLSIARDYADTNPEIWKRLYRAISRVNTQWVSEGRVPGRIIQKVDHSKEAPQTPNPESIATEDSGSTRTDATPYYPDPDFRPPPTRAQKRKARALKQAYRPQGTSDFAKALQQLAGPVAPRQPIDPEQLSKPESFRRSSEQAEPSTLENPRESHRLLKLRISYSRLLKFPKNDQWKPATSSRMPESKVTKPRKSLKAKASKDGVNHRPVTRSQAARSRFETEVSKSKARAR